MDGTSYITEHRFLCPCFSSIRAIYLDIFLLSGHSCARFQEISGFSKKSRFKFLIPDFSTPGRRSTQTRAFFYLTGSVPVDPPIPQRKGTTTPI